MGYLDNLESSLKSLEGNNERDTGQERQRQKEERARALSIGPSAEALKKSPFTNDLLMETVRIGHGMRVKINMAWIGSTLRLDARERRLELRPTAEGVEAVFSEDGQQVAVEAVDLNGSALQLAERWLVSVGEDGDV